MDDFLRLLHHLRFRNPQRGLGDGDGEIINLDAIELFYGDANRVDGRAEDDLAALLEVDDLVFQTANAQVCFS